MWIRDNEEVIQVDSDLVLEAFLNRRYEFDGILVNSFWLCHVEELPALSMLVRDDLACFDYMGDDKGNALFCSQGDLPNLDPDAMTEFRLETMRQPVLNSHIIPFADAVRAAKEFLRSPELPTSIRWLQI